MATLLGSQKPAGRMQALSGWPLALILVLLSLLVMSLLKRLLLHRQTARSEALKNSNGIVLGITRGFIFGIGGLVLLGTLGISVTPIIASLGITSLAVALALQPTLENFFRAYNW